MSARPGAAGHRARGGVHVYSGAGYVVNANRNFLSIYAPGGVTRIVRLPERATVVDLLAGRTIASNVTEFDLEIAANTAVLLRLERGQ